MGNATAQLVPHLGIPPLFRTTQGLQNLVEFQLQVPEEVVGASSLASKILVGYYKFRKRKRIPPKDDEECKDNVEQTSNLSKHLDDRQIVHLDHLHLVLKIKLINEISSK